MQLSANRRLVAKSIGIVELFAWLIRDDVAVYR